MMQVFIAQAGAAAQGEAEEKAVASLSEALIHSLNRVVDLPPIVDLVIVRSFLVIATMALAWVVLRVVRFTILKAGTRFLERHIGSQSSPRVKTLTGLFYSIAKYVIGFCAFILALYQAGINPAPFLGGAAVVGLAVGFGSQDLVKDVLTGVFMLVEDQFTIGEYVELAGKTGRVVEMSMRMVVVRDSQGRLHSIPYRNITLVTNYSRTAVPVMVDVFVTSSDDLKRAGDVLEHAISTLGGELPNLILRWEMVGTQNTGTAFALVRARVECVPEQKDFVQGELALHIKRAFSSESLSIPDDRIRFFATRD